MGNHQLALIPGIIAVAVVAAHILVHLAQNLIKGQRVGIVPQVIDQFGIVRGFTGQTVCQRMGPLGLCHIRQGIAVANGTAVVLGKAKAGIHRGQIRILIQIADPVGVVRVGLQGCRNFRIHGGPLLGGNHAVIVCRGRRLPDGKGPGLPGCQKRLPGFPASVIIHRAQSDVDKD